MPNESNKCERALMRSKSLIEADVNPADIIDDLVHKGLVEPEDKDEFLPDAHWVGKAAGSAQDRQDAIKLCSTNLVGHIHNLIEHGDEIPSAEPFHAFKSVLESDYNWVAAKMTKEYDREYKVHVDAELCRSRRKSGTLSPRAGSRASSTSSPSPLTTSGMFSSLSGGSSSKRNSIEESSVTREGGDH